MHCTSQALGIKKEALSTLKAAAVWFSRARARWFLQLEPTSYGDSLRMILMSVMTMVVPDDYSDDVVDEVDDDGDDEEVRDDHVANSANDVDDANIGDDFVDDDAAADDIDDTNEADAAT